jgi:hypothetical protein
LFVPKVEIIHRKISPNLTITLDMKYKSLIILSYFWLHIENQKYRNLAIFTFFSSVLEIENLQNSFPDFLIFIVFSFPFWRNIANKKKNKAIHLLTSYRTCRRCLFQKKASVSEDRTRRPHKTRSSSFYGFFWAFCFVFPRVQRAPSSIDPSICKTSDSCLSANPCQLGLLRVYYCQVHQETEEWEHGEQRSGRPGGQKRV